MDGVKDPKIIKRYYHNLLHQHINKIDHIYNWIYQLTPKERYDIGVEVYVYDTMNTYIRTIVWSTKFEREQFVILQAINRSGVMHFRISSNLAG